MPEHEVKDLKTPYYLLDESAIIGNLKVIADLCEKSGAKALLALKCFATWGAFDAMKPYLHGTTSSSLNEVRLGKEMFGGETHAYSVAYHPDEIEAVLNHADKVIFNSLSQLEAFCNQAEEKSIPVGLRINPQTSNSSFLIADPARPFSRLGEHDVDKVLELVDHISGVMIHNNCENHSFEAFSASLDDIEAKFAVLLQQLDWVSLGGGIHFIAPDYPVDKLAARLKGFSETYGVQVYLEPGEACIHQGATLVTTVLDTMHNGKALAVVDASIEAHMLDLLIYRESAPLDSINDEPVDKLPLGCVKKTAEQKLDKQKTAKETDEEQAGTGNLENEQTTIVYGKSCLAGDIFGEYPLSESLRIGDRLAFGNAAGYTMVKKNWFNGVDMPSIVIKRADGTVVVQKQFGYEDYKASLS